MNLNLSIVCNFCENKIHVYCLTIIWLFFSKRTRALFSILLVLLSKGNKYGTLLLHYIFFVHSVCNLTKRPWVVMNLLWNFFYTLNVVSVHYFSVLIHTLVIKDCVIVTRVAFCSLVLYVQLIMYGVLFLSSYFYLVRFLMVLVVLVTVCTKAYCSSV